MRKSSRSISLALIGSALVLGGCGPAAEESEWSAGNEEGTQDWGEPTANEQALATGNGQYNHGGSGGRAASGIGGAIIGSQIGRAIGGGNRAPGYGGSPGNYGGGGVASPSARGGFGSSAGSAGSVGSSSAS